MSSWQSNMRFVIVVRSAIPFGIWLVLVSNQPFVIANDARIELFFRKIDLVDSASVTNIRSYVHRDELIIEHQELQNDGLRAYIILDSLCGKILGLGNDRGCYEYSEYKWRHVVDDVIFSFYFGNGIIHMIENESDSCDVGYVYRLEYQEGKGRQEIYKFDCFDNNGIMPYKWCISVDKEARISIVNDDLSVCMIIIGENMSIRSEAIK